MKTILGLLGVITTFSVLAQPSTSEYGIVGLSASYGTSVFTPDDSASLGVVPNLFYNGDRLFVDGSLVNYTLFSYVGLSANWRFEEVSKSVSDIPTGINNRKGNPELGITVGTAGARVTYLHDVAGVHEGQEIQFHVGRTFETAINKFSLTPFAEVDWRDKKLSNHLYGISAEESIATGLDRFNADESWVYQAGVIGLYEITDNIVIFNKFRVEHHDSASQLIQRDHSWTAEMGLVYKFAG